MQILILLKFACEVTLWDAAIIFSEVEFSAVSVVCNVNGVGKE